MRGLSRCLASLPLRTAVGIGCIHHGWHNLVLADERQAFLWMLQSIGIARPQPLLWLISIVSLVGGLALLLGAFVRLASVALAANVPAILLAIHWPSGFDYVHLTAVTSLGPQYGMPGFEVSILYLAALSSLVISGAGPYSLDARRTPESLLRARQTKEGAPNPTPVTHPWRSFGTLVVLTATATMGCASAGARSADWTDKGILLTKRHSAALERVDSAAARALLDLGYTIARDSGTSGRHIHAAPRATWDDCVEAEIRSASQHPIVEVFVVVRRHNDSTESTVGAQTLRRVPDVMMGDKRTNADLIVKLCAIISVVARMDTLLGAAGPIPAAISAVGDSGQSLPTPESSAYDNFVRQLRGGDTLLDYTEARLAYARTANYRPYPVRWEGSRAMFAALGRHDYAEVRRLSDSILSTNYVDPDAHLGAMAAAFSLGDSARGQFHGAVYRGLIGSIGLRSGRTIDSAMIVITLQEEYAVLRARGLERTAVATLQCGRSMCDQMEVIDRKTRTKSTLYFDISIPQAWGARQFRQP